MTKSVIIKLHITDPQKRRARAHRIFKTATKIPARTHGSTASDYNNRNACDRPNTGFTG